MGKIANRQSLAILDRGVKSQLFSQFCCIGVFKTNRQSRVSNRSFKSQGRQRGDASFFRSGSGEGLSEPVMEFPAVLGVFQTSGATLSHF